MIAVCIRYIPARQHAGAQVGGLRLGSPASSRRVSSMTASHSRSDGLRRLTDVVDHHCVNVCHDAVIETRLEEALEHEESIVSLNNLRLAAAFVV